MANLSPRAHLPSMPRRRSFVADDPSLDRSSGPCSPEPCWLCFRPLGTRVEWHHPQPKSEGGRRTVPVHPICHRTLHASFTNKELARLEQAGERPADQPILQAFLRFLARKPPDFHAPTRRRR